MKKKELERKLRDALFANSRLSVRNDELIREKMEMLNCCEGCHDELPDIYDIIIDNGMTAVVWDDGTHTRTHCRPGDEFDPLFGVIACIVRKLTHNRGHGVDALEPAIRDVASCIRDMDDVHNLTDYLMMLLDILAVLTNSSELWLRELGPAQDEPKQDAAPAASSCDNGREKSLDELLKEHEDVRQRIRELIDAGEL